MQKSLILVVFGSVVVVCIAAQMFSVQRPMQTAKAISAYLPAAHATN